LNVVSVQKILSSFVGPHNHCFPEVLGSISFAIATITYLFTVATYFDLRVFIIQERITYDFLFQQNTVSELGDQMIIIICSLIWFFCFLNWARLTKTLICCAYGILAAVAVLFGIDDLLFGMALISVPIIGGLLIFERFHVMTQRNLKWTWNLYLDSLLAIALIIGILSLVFSLMIFFTFQFSLLHLLFMHLIWCMITLTRYF
jgi:hypothetical protein